MSAAARENAIHPEDYCHRCGGPNISWSASNSLWNSVMRDNKSWGDWEEIICPLCFAKMAEVKLGPQTWSVAPRVHEDNDA